MCPQRKDPVHCFYNNLILATCSADIWSVNLNWYKASPVWSGEMTECCCSVSGMASTLVKSSPGRSPAIGCGWVKTHMNPFQSANLRLMSLLWSAACRERSAAICQKTHVSVSRLDNEKSKYYIILYYISLVLLTDQQYRTKSKDIEMEIWTFTIPWQLFKLHLLMKIMWHDQKLQNSF